MESQLVNTATAPLIWSHINQQTWKCQGKVLEKCLAGEFQQTWKCQARVQEKMSTEGFFLEKVKEHRITLSYKSKSLYPSTPHQR